MNTQQAQELLNRATAQLATANEELNRPMEDVVSYSICHGVRKSTAELFRFFLLMNGINSGKAKSLEALRKLCASVDASFDKLDLSSMDCAGLSASADDHFCLGIDRVKICLKVANQVQKQVINVSSG